MTDVKDHNDCLMSGDRVLNVSDLHSWHSDFVSAFVWLLSDWLILLLPPHNSFCLADPFSLELIGVRPVPGSRLGGSNFTG